MEEEENYNKEQEYNRTKYISDSEKKTTYHEMGQTQSFKCPRCGSWNTGQSAGADWCNSCDYSEGYW